MKAYSCGHDPTVLIILNMDSEIKFAMCDDDKKDFLFDTGFTEEKI